MASRRARAYLPLTALLTGSASFHQKMPLPAKNTYEIQGHTFVLAPTTPKRRDALDALIKAKDEEQRDFVAAVSAAESAGVSWVSRLDLLPDPPDEYRFYFDVFCAVTDGPHEKLVFEDFDTKAGEVALQDFLPTQKLTELRLIGFLPFPVQ